MIGQLSEVIGSFGDAEQGGRAEFAKSWMLPPGERLGADDPPARDRHLRLEQDLDLVLVERAAQIDLELVAERGFAPRAGVHHRIGPASPLASARAALARRSRLAESSPGAEATTPMRLPRVITWSPHMNGLASASTSWPRGSGPRRGWSARRA
jgi:hypothetical protein